MAAETEKKAKAPELDVKKVYTVIGTGTNKHIAKGSESIIGGGDAMILIEKGAVTLKAESKD